MAKLNPNKKEAIARKVFEYRMLRDAEDYAEKGESAVLQCVSSERRVAFDRAVKDLDNIGCRRDVLFCNLYRLKHATDQQFPSTKRIRTAASSIAKAATQIRWLQQVNVPQALLPAYPTSDSVSFLANPRLPTLLDECAQFLRIWWLPRKDLLISYAKVANCLYPTIVSENPPELSKNKYYFPLIINLFDAFGDTSVNAEGDPQLLGKNVANFRKSHPSVFKLVGQLLSAEHADSGRQEFAVRRKRSAPPSKPPFITCPFEDFGYMMQGWIDLEDDTTG